MDFGEILDDWERIKREHKDTAQAPAAAPAGKGGERGPKAEKAASPTSGARGALQAWLDSNVVSDKDADSNGDETMAERGLESRRLSSLKAEASLDLHGLKAEEAAAAIDEFLVSASRRGLEKVLVIHGKGLHSEGEPVLKRTARRALEAHPLAGRIGQAGKAEGGSGALWVLIRKRGLR